MLCSLRYADVNETIVHAHQFIFVFHSCVLFQSCVFAFVTSGVACLQQQQQKTDVFSEISGQ
jgi:hypothetical protein